MISATWRRLQTQDKTSILLFIGVLIVMVWTANRSLTFYSNDVIYVARPAWTLGLGGTLDIGRFTPTDIANWSFTYNGETRSDRFPGAILFAALFYAIGRPNLFTMVPAAVAAAFACAVAATVLHRLLLGIVRPRTALGGALIFAFGTSMWSVASDAIWTEGPVIMGLALATWAMTRQSWVLAGLGYAFAIFSRPHTAVFAAVSGIWEGVTRRSIVPVLKVGLASALGFAGLLLWNKLNSGRWDIFPGSYGGRISGATTSGTYGQASGGERLADYSATFFSPLRGVFVYSPFLLLLLPGLVRAWRIAPSWVRSTAIAGVVYLVVQLAGNSWFGGGGIFGYRLILPSLFAWWPLLALSWDQWTAKRTWSRYIFYALTAASVWWFAQGSLVFRLDYVNANPNEFLEWQSWNVPRILDWAGPFGWLAAALFVAGLFFILSLVPDAEQPGESGNDGRTKAQATGSAPVRAEDKDLAVAAIVPGAKGSSKRRSGGPDANKKRR